MCCVLVYSADIETFYSQNQRSLTLQMRSCSDDEYSFGFVRMHRLLLFSRWIQVSSIKMLFDGMRAVKDLTWALIRSSV